MKGNVVRRICCLSLLVTLGLCAIASASEKIDLSSAKIVVLSPKNKIQANAGDILRDEIEKRTRIGLHVVSKMPGAGKVAILIGTAKQLSEKSYEPQAGFRVPEKTAFIDMMQNDQPQWLDGVVFGPAPAFSNHSPPTRQGPNSVRELPRWANRCSTAFGCK